MSEHIVEFLNDYLDDELTEPERAAIEKHLYSCGTCRDLLNELTSLKQQLIETYQEIEIPDLIEDSVLAKIELESMGINPGRLKRTAIFMLGVLGGIFLAATTPFLTVWVHIFQTVFSISRAIIYAIPSIISAIPFAVEVTAAFIVLLITMTVLVVKYIISSIGKTAGAEEI